MYIIPPQITAKIKLITIKLSHEKTGKASLKRVNNPVKSIIKIKSPNVDPLTSVIKDAFEDAFFQKMPATKTTVIGGAR